ncbi:MAG: glutamate--tRNA ligase [Alphaproteobacteria bacterium]|nr:glutamate--tRNA ligase [Alphaproteobacteria bacterium]
MNVVVRFAPSPTGFLHIGGARTALFNWLYARHHGGHFLLRIEDTDRTRSTPEAVKAILDSLTWLGLDWDGPEAYQSTRAERHAAVARELLAAGKAYRCWATPDELAAMREAQKGAGQPVRYDGRWRDRDPAEAPAGIEPVIRLRAPRDGATTVEDKVQGAITVGNDQLDDMVLLRADGTPTYMLAVVVDDHDMGVTQVIRGADHLTNTFRQVQIFHAMGWPEPGFAHVPLIHGADGAKFSKRHGALGVEAYRDMGLLPEAMRNYLLRLGWSHGDEEIIPTEQAILWFDLDAVGRSPARFDIDKLLALNAHYLRGADDGRLADLIAARRGVALAPDTQARLRAGMAGLKQRARTVIDLAEAAEVYIAGAAIAPDAKARALLDEEARARLGRLRQRLAALGVWDAASLEDTARQASEAEGVKLGAIAQPLRAALTGRTVSPGIFEVMVVLGRDLALARLDVTAR